MQAVIVTCDAKSSSTLDWRKVRQEALQQIALGKKILWHLDFGLFDRVLKPLNDPGQFSNFALAIDHFQDTLLKEFHKFSLGVALYKGSCDYSSQVSFDCDQKVRLSDWLKNRFKNEKELEAESKGDLIGFDELNVIPKTQEGKLILKLFIRDICREYLELLASKVSITPYVIFDEMPDDLLLKLLLTNPEHYGKIAIWNLFSWKTHEEKSVGVYMPAPSIVKPSKLFPYRSLLEKLNGTDYKLIPESDLIMALENLDTLYFHKEAISFAGQRKIQGFLAAGGEIHAI